MKSTRGMMEKYTAGVERIRARLDAAGTLDDEGFLDHFSEAGLLAAVSGEAIHPAILDWVRSTLDYRVGCLVVSSLVDVLEIIETGIGEDLALGIAELQMWSSALEALAKAEGSRDLFSPAWEGTPWYILEKANTAAEEARLGWRAAAAIHCWRDEVGIPCESQIPAVSAIESKPEDRLVYVFQEEIAKGNLKSTRGNDDPEQVVDEEHDGEAAICPVCKRKCLAPLFDRSLEEGDCDEFP